MAVKLAKAAGARVVAIAGGKDRTDHAVQVLGADARSTTAIPHFRSACSGPRARVSTCSSTTLAAFIVSDFYPQRLLPIRAELAVLLRAKQRRVVVSEFAGLRRAPEALATAFDRGSPYIGRRVVRISEG